MGIAYQQTTAVFDDVVGVECAEEFMQWLIRHPEGNLDLAACTHLHAAQLQVLMSAQRAVVKWPQDDSLRMWLKAALGSEQAGG